MATAVESVTEQMDAVDACGEHEGDLFVDGCAACTTEDEMKMVALQGTSDRVGRVMQGLAAEGMQIPPAHILGLRLEALIETLVQDRGRYAFEARCLDALLTQLDDVQRELRKQALMGGKPDGLIVPKGRG